MTLALTPQSCEINLAFPGTLIPTQRSCRLTTPLPPSWSGSGPRWRAASPPSSPSPPHCSPPPLGSWAVGLEGVKLLHLDHCIVSASPHFLADPASQTAVGPAIKSFPSSSQSSACQPLETNCKCKHSRCIFDCHDAKIFHLFLWAVDGAEQICASRVRMRSSLQSYHWHPLTPAPLYRSFFISKNRKYQLSSRQMIHKKDKFKSS